MRALYICGSLNQTKMMYAVSRHLPEFRAFFTPYYCDGYLRPIHRIGILDWTVMGGRFLRQTLEFLNERGVSIDYEGRLGPYDLVVTCSDLIVPKNVRRSKLVLVQEGMTDPNRSSITWSRHCPCRAGWPPPRPPGSPMPTTSFAWPRRVTVTCS